MQQQQQQPTTPTRVPARGNGGAQQSAQQMYGFNGQPADYGAVPTLPSQSLDYGQDHLTGQQAHRQPQQQTPQQQPYAQYPAPNMYAMAQTPNQQASMAYTDMSQYRATDKRCARDIGNPI
ncbi:hypothetical protein MRB53_041134 [Persea americana]|nr:hypothetical protein MRB53_041134 [Persea americana]